MREIEKLPANQQRKESKNRMQSKKQDAKSENKLKLNSINFITPEELEKMPQVSIEVNRVYYPAKNNKPASENYSAVCKLDPRGHVKFPIRIDANQWLLLHYLTGRNYPANQFVVPGKIRLIETQWPESPTRKAHNTVHIEVYVDEDLRWDFDITRSDFYKVFKKAIERGDVNKVFTPYTRVPGTQETEIPSMELPKDNSDIEMPF